MYVLVLKLLGVYWLLILCTCL